MSALGHVWAPMHTTPRRLTALAFVALVASLPREAGAQERPSLTQQSQAWVAFNYQGPLAGRLGVVGDVQYRVWDDFTPQQVLVRQALVWWFTPRLFAGVGYAWTPFWRGPGLEGFVDEHRIYQVLQYQYNHAPSGFVLQLRTRVEQRLRHPDAGVEVGLRARQMVRALLPVTADRKLSVIAWDEVFVHLANSGGEPSGVDATGAATRTAQWAYTGFDQNRAFLGMGYQLIPGVLRLELGYLNQFVRRPNNPAGDLMSHIALLQVFTAWR